MKRYILSLSLIVSCLFSFAQMGKDGNKIVNSTEIVNEYTRMVKQTGTSYSPGNTNFEVTNSTLNTNNRFGGALEKGDLLFIYQIQDGASINIQDNTVSFGAINFYGQLGNNEFVEVDSVDYATNTIFTACPLKNYYTVGGTYIGNTIIVRVPRYQSLTVNSVLTCPYWNGQEGGVLVVEVEGDLNIGSSGVIDVASRGFRGGRLQTSSLNGQFGVMDYKKGSGFTNWGGEKGEGAGFNRDSIGFNLCRGALANGGGGGNGHNAGGGGGANAGDISLWTGNGRPDISNMTWIQAWNLEYSGFATDPASGGGRGGYSHSGSDMNLDALVVGPNDTTWRGDYRRPTGGLGGRPLDYSTGRLFMGGGGGSGEQNNDFGGAGGAGGGLLYILCNGNVTGGGAILAAGENGFNTTNAGSAYLRGVDAAGGAGAGGTVIIDALSIGSNIYISAIGGNGGTQTIYQTFFHPTDEAEGPGGGGGGGYVRYPSGSTPIIDIAGGFNGTTNSTGLTEFIPNGATQGSPGLSATNDIFYASCPNDTFCLGNQNEYLIAFYNGIVPIGTNLYWYNNEIGGNFIGAGNILTVIPDSVGTFTVWMGFCPGHYRTPVTYTVVDFNPTISNDVTICAGGSTSLSISGGVSYIWSPAASLSSATSANPIASPLITTTYTVTATSADNCVEVRQVVVNVGANIIATISTDTSVCYGDSIQLVASGGIIYNWSPTTNISNINVANPMVAPLTDTRYYVTVSDGAICSDTASVMVRVNSLPTVTTSSDVYMCNGDTAQLNAISTALVFNWTPSTFLNNTSISNPLCFANIDTKYYVSVLDANLCSATDSVNVFVDTSFHPQVSNNNITICDGDTALLNASGGLTYQWSPSAGLSATNIANPIATPINTVTYTVTISGDAIYGCSQIIDVVVNVEIIDAVTSLDTAICWGSSVQISASGAANYLWSPAISLDNSNIANPTASPLSTTMYYVTVSSSLNCYDIDSVLVSVNALPQVDAGIDINLCIGDSAQLQASGASTYQWGPPNYLSDPLIANPLAGITSDYTYYVLGTDSNQCQNVDSVKIWIKYPTTVDLGQDTTVCSDQSVVLDAQNPGLTYYWSNNQNTQTILAQNAGIYSVIVVDSFMCEGYDTIEIIHIPREDASIIMPASVCANANPFTMQSVQNGGLWYSNGIINGVIGEFDPQIVGAGTHQIIYVISGQCGDQDTINYIVNPLPIIEFTSIDESCIGANDGSIDLTISNAYPPYLFNWSHGYNTQNVIMLTPDTYTVVVIDSNQCADSIMIDIYGGLVDCYIPHVFIPTAFTPNNDGLNDYYCVYGRGVTDIYWDIHDRWGKKVYESSYVEQDLNIQNSGWNAEYNGEKCMNGIYIVSVKAVLENGEIIEESKSIELQ